MTELHVTVVGTPVAQGSKTANRFGHGVRDSNAKTLKPWRAEVAGVIADTMTRTGWTTLDGPISVELQFLHARIAGHYGSGRNAGRLKPSAPTWKSTAPDIDKLTRAVLDSLTTSRAIRDDGRIARLVVEDKWTEGSAGVEIRVRSLTETTVPVLVNEQGEGSAAGAGTVHTIQEALL